MVGVEEELMQPEEREEVVSGLSTGDHLLLTRLGWSSLGTKTPHRFITIVLRTIGFSNTR